jgi:hypothetical protein
MRKTLKMDWDAINLNNMLKASENVYKIFQNLNVALEK